MKKPYVPETPEEKMERLERTAKNPELLKRAIEVLTNLGYECKVFNEVSCHIRVFKKDKYVDYYASTGKIILNNKKVKGIKEIWLENLIDVLSK